MRLNNLSKTINKRKKFLGRGIASGKGKTATRGQKGQKARGRVPLANVGAGLIFYKKLPLKRGWGNKKVSLKPKLINLADLNSLAPKTVVNLETLIEAKIISVKEARKGVKILSGGELKIPLTVKLPLSKGAFKAVKLAGGQVG